MQPEGKKAVGDEGSAPAPIRRRRRHRDDHEGEHAAHAHDESNWLVSYADMMTLLFGFFVLMYSFSRVDKEKFEIVSKDLVKYFGGQVRNDAGAPEGVKAIRDKLMTGVGSVEDSSEFKVEIKGDALVFTIGSDLLFAPGSARPNEKAVAVFNKVYESIKDKPIELLEVEGHTDGDPISTVTFPSNWELSTGRASSVVRVFENLGVAPDHLKAAGYGPSRPVVPEKNEKGEPVPESKGKNRRVVINLKVDTSGAALKKVLAEKGLDVKKPDARPLTQDSGVTSGNDELNGLQERYEAMNRKLTEAAQKLQEAKEREKKVKDLEKLAKKTEELERKIQETEAKTKQAEASAKQTVEQAGKPVQPDGKPDAKTPTATH